MQKNTTLDLVTSASKKTQAYIASIGKNSFQDIRISKQRYMGKDYIDIRVHTYGSPTKQGVKIRPEQLPDFIKILIDVLGYEPQPGEGVA